MAVTNRLKYWGFVGLGVTLGVLACGAMAYRLATDYLKEQVVTALGPRSEVAGIQVAWAGVIVTGLRFLAPEEWRAADTLRADRVVI